MSKQFTTKGVLPVATFGGIMPGGPEMTHWYNHIPYPNPDTLAELRAELFARIEEEKAGRPVLGVVQGGEPEVRQAA